MESPARGAPRAPSLINHGVDAVACLHRRREVRVGRVRWTCAHRARAMGLADSRHQAGHLGGAADRRRAPHRDHRRVSSRLRTRRHHRATGGRGPGRSAGPDRPAGRFGGGLGSRLPYTLAIVGAALAILTRLDLGALFVRGSAPRGGLSTYVGWDGQVIAPIQAGGYGQITMRDAMGYPLSAGATAETAIAP